MERRSSAIVNLMFVDVTKVPKNILPNLRIGWTNRESTSKSRRVTRLAGVCSASLEVVRDTMHQNH